MQFKFQNIFKMTLYDRSTIDINNMSDPDIRSLIVRSILITLYSRDGCIILLCGIVGTIIS